MLPATRRFSTLLCTALSRWSEDGLALPLSREGQARLTEAGQQKTVT